MAIRMSTTLTIRILRKLKEKMENNPAELSQEVRNFLEARVRQMELLKTLKDIESKAKRRSVKTDSTTLIRRTENAQTNSLHLV
jgi:hypothetical protein